MRQRGSQTGSGRRSGTTSSGASCVLRRSRLHGPLTRKADRRRGARGDRKRSDCQVGRAGTRGGTARGHRRRVPPELLASGLFLGIRGINHVQMDHGYLFHGVETRADSARVSGKIRFAGIRSSAIIAICVRSQGKTWSRARPSRRPHSCWQSWSAGSTGKRSIGSIPIGRNSIGTSHRRIARRSGILRSRMPQSAAG